MTFDLGNIDQSSKWFDANVYLPFYERLNEQEDSTCLKSSGVIIGIADAALNLLQSTVSVAESGSKGLVNIMGSPCFKSCDFGKGLFQLGLGAPAITFLAIPIAVTRLIRVSRSSITDPKAFFQSEIERIHELARECAVQHS